MQYGLRFKSYEVEKENRTSLLLTPEKPLSLPSRYTLAFDLMLHDNKDGHPFGYICRVIGEKGQHLNMLLNIARRTRLLNLTFTYSSEELFMVTFNEAGIHYDEWNHVEIQMDTEQSSLSVHINGQTYKKDMPDMKGLQKVHIIYGKSKYPGLETVDVPSMSIKNIQIIQERKQKLLYEWQLKKHLANGVYDEVSKKKAIAENPCWILDQHARWKKQYAVTTRLHPQIAYNSDTNETGIYDQDLFFHYNNQTQQLAVDTVSSPLPAVNRSNDMIYNPVTRKYLHYQTQLDHPQYVVAYDRTAKKWEKNEYQSSTIDYWHHNRLLSPAHHQLYLFGGYGHRRYKNNIQIYDLQTGKWERTVLKGDTLHPRYLAGLGKWDEKHILLFGGYGSESGEQELAPRFYYDLYKVNVETWESQKIWSMETPETDFVVSNSLVVDTVSRSFYALTYPSHQFFSYAVLQKFSVDRPEYISLADSIPVHFEDTRSYIDLFADKTSRNLIAVISGPEAINEPTNIVSIYSLTHPFLNNNDLVQSEKTAKSNWIFIGAGLFILICLYAGYQARKKKKAPSVHQKEIKAEPEEIKTAKPLKSMPQSQSIYLFGNFCVIDKEGNDITRELTPMLKQLFILLFLYTHKEPKGISSVRLKDILWYDKSEESAKNNRGVSIRKLRQIFERIGDIQIKSENSYWRIEVAGNTYCDYSELQDFMEKSPDISKARIPQLLSVVSRGEFLPDLQVEWLDSFKADISNDLTDLLLVLSKRPDVHADAQLCIELADAIFIHDSLNEEALQLKCSALVRLGRNGLARNTFESFKKEYQLLFGTTFSFTFDQVINPS